MSWKMDTTLPWVGSVRVTEHFKIEGLDTSTVSRKKMEELKEVFGRIIEVEAHIKEFEEEHKKKIDPKNNATYTYHNTELDLITKKYLEAQQQYLKRRAYLEKHINRIAKECMEKEREPLHGWWILQKDDLLQERDRLLKSLGLCSKS